MKNTLVAIILFFVPFGIVQADSFLLISSPESFVSKENFFASGDGILIIQKQIKKTSQIQILETPLKKRLWFFQINPMDDLVTMGIHKVVMSFHQAKNFGEEEGATLEVSFTTDSRSAGRYVGLARIHEARYTRGKNLRGLAIDVLLFGENFREYWNYIEIRQNSTVPHTVQFSPEKLPTLEELENLFRE